MSVLVDREATGTPTGGRIFCRDYSVRRICSPTLVYTFAGDRFHQPRRCFLRPRNSLLAVLGASLLCAGTLSTPAAAQTMPAQPEPVEVNGARQLDDVIPAPVETHPNEDTDFWLSPVTQIRTEPGSEKAAQIGQYLAEQLRPATGYPLPVNNAENSVLPAISLELGNDIPEIGDQGYTYEADHQ